MFFFSEMMVYVQGSRFCITCEKIDAKTNPSPNHTEALTLITCFLKDRIHVPSSAQFSMNFSEAPAEGNKHQRTKLYLTKMALCIIQQEKSLSATICDIVRRGSYSQ